MAYGSNDKRGTTTNSNSSHHENHIVNVSSASATTTTSLPNNPRPTPNHFPHFFGTAQSFNNYKDGLQDFSHAKIKSPTTADSFNNLGTGSQTFKDAQILCADKSTKQGKSIFPSKPGHDAHHGTLNSFNNNGNGSQNFDGFKLN